MTGKGLAVSLLAVVLLTGCSRNTGLESGPTPSGGVPPALTVATADFPSTWLAEQVGGKGVEVRRLPAAGITDTSADLFVYVPGLDPQVDSAAATLPAERVVDLTENTARLAGAQDPAVRDPYVWFDPLNIGVMADTLSEALTDASATTLEASQYYGLLSLSVRTKAEDLDGDLLEKFDACRNGTLVVDAPVLTYLARTYTFQQVPLLLWRPGRQPVSAIYYTPDQAGPVRQAAEVTGVDAVEIESLARSAPGDDLLTGIARVGNRIAAHQDCPVVKPTSTDRPR